VQPTNTSGPRPTIANCPTAIALESDVAQSVARKVEVTVTGEERSRLVATRHVSPEVYESYLKGQFARGNSRAEIERSIAYFEEAISKDATFAPAYVGLANAYEGTGDHSSAFPRRKRGPKQFKRRGRHRTWIQSWRRLMLC